MGLDLPEIFEALKISQGKASGFTASSCHIPKNCGFTATFPVPFMRPSFVCGIMSNSIDILCMDYQAAVDTLEKALTISILPHKIHETNLRNAFELCVESIAGDSLGAYFTFHPHHPRLCYKRQMQIFELIPVVGVATEKSSSDGIVYSSFDGVNIGHGINELKDTSFSPLEQHGQIYAIATSLCLGQLKHGLEYDQCCVAFCATNGQLFQFGFVTLLHPSFPVMHITSRVIDIYDKDGLHEAAVHLCRMRSFCRTQHIKLAECTTRTVGDVKMSLNRNIYYRKPVSSIFPRCDSQLQSMLNLYKIFQKLYDNGIDCCILPVALMSGELEQKAYLGNDILLFPMLSEKFKMGVPGNAEDFEKYMKALKASYDLLHNAGVVHLDGYPSNILWAKRADDTVVIRFVDLDVASNLNEHFDSGIRNRFLSTEFTGSFFYWGGDTEIARIEHDAWFVYIFSCMTEEERRESYTSGKERNVGAIVSSYWKVVVRLRQNHNFARDFEKWFEDAWHLL